LLLAGASISSTVKIADGQEDFPSE